MNKIKIIIDSTCDLTPEYIKEHDIEVVPLLVTHNGNEYKDGIDITIDQLYTLVDETGILPKTSALSVGVLIDVFQKNIDEGYDIFYTGISSSMSSTYQNAMIAAESVCKERIEVFDSKNLSTGTGLLVLKAVKMREEGKNIHEIAEYLANNVRDNVRAQFLIEQMDYLHKGGRCSALASFFGRAFHIKPIIRVENGNLKVFKKPIGRTINACNALLDIIKSDLANLDLDCVMITSTRAETSEKYLYEKLSEMVDPSKIMITKAGCVISSHCGPGTIGILYIVK